MDMVGTQIFLLLCFKNSATKIAITMLNSKLKVFLKLCQRFTKTNIDCVNRIKFSHPEGEYKESEDVF